MLLNLKMPDVCFVCRRLYRRYSSDGRLTEIISDSELISYSYNNTTRSLVSLNLLHNLYNLSLHYQTNGTLHDRHDVTINSHVSHLKFADVSYKYKYSR